MIFFHQLQCSRRHEKCKNDTKLINIWIFLKFPNLKVFFLLGVMNTSGRTNCMLLMAQSRRKISNVNKRKSRQWPGALFSKALETFRARKAIFGSSVWSKNGEVYTPETSYMKWSAVHIKNMWIK